MFRTETSAGSVFHNIVAENQILWGDDEHLVFPWKKGGWTQLYSVSAVGGTATLLTPGAFEVEHVTLSADRRSVVFSSNQDDIDRRHLWSVPMANGRPTAVTTGAGIEWSPA